MREYTLEAGGQNGQEHGIPSQAELDLILVLPLTFTICSTSLCLSFLLQNGSNSVQRVSLRRLNDMMHGKHIMSNRR